MTVVTPRPVHDDLRVERDPARTVVLSGLVLVLLQALLRGWLGLRGSLLQDDLVYESRAATGHLPLFHAYNGHLMPGGFLLARALTSIAPLEVWPVVTVDLVLQAATGLLLLALLCELFGARRAVLVPLALFLFSPVTLTGFAWWAAALAQLPLLLATTATLLLHVRYLRSGRTVTGLLAVLTYATGLAFFEKSLLLAPLALTLTVVWFVPGSIRLRLLRTLRWHGPVWAAWGVVTAGYLAVYLATVESTVGRSASPTGVLDLFGTAVHGLRVAVVGGPWAWTTSGDATSGVPAIGGFLSVLSWVVVVVVVGGSLAVFRQSGRAWALPLVLLVVTVGLLAFGRAGYGADIGLAYRYFGDVTLLTALALALALLPLRGTVAHGRVAPLEPRDWVLVARQRVGGSWSPSAHTRTAAVRTVVVVLVLSCTVSTLRYDAVWHASPARGYVDRARAALAPGVVVADLPVPTQVLSPLFGRERLASRALAPLAPPSSFLTTGHASDTLAGLDDSGRARPVLVGGDLARPGPRPDCGWFGTGPAGVAVPLQAALFDADWTARIGYLASVATPAVVTAGRQAVPVTLSPGLHALYVQLSGPVSEVRLSGLAPGASLCTDDVAVGTPTVVAP